MSRSFIVTLWSQIFSFLGKISLFYVVRFILKKKVAGPAFPEAWTLFHCLLAFLSLSIAVYQPRSFVLYLVIYGFLRVFEIIIYQINALLFDEYRANSKGHTYTLHGYRRMVVLLLHNYFEIIFWFTSSYVYLQGNFEFASIGAEKSIISSLYNSFVFTLGEPSVIAKHGGATYVLFFHLFVGVFMTLLSLARFIALLPGPKSIDPVESQLYSENK